MTGAGPLGQPLEVCLSGMMATLPMAWPVEAKLAWNAGILVISVFIYNLSIEITITTSREFLSYQVSSGLWL